MRRYVTEWQHEYRQHSVAAATLAAYCSSNGGTGGNGSSDSTINNRTSRHLLDPYVAMAVAPFLPRACTQITATPPVSPEKMMTVKSDSFAYLTKKLVHLSVLLEQDTISDDTKYPSF